jgi:hypothetical protein
MQNASFKISHLTVLFLFPAISCFSQESSNSSGGDASGNGGTVAYTVGQVAFTTATGNGGTMAQGVQQPYEIFVVTGIEEASIQLTATVYPNPTSKEIILTLGGLPPTVRTAHLTDINGKMISTWTIVADQTRFSLSDLPMGIYLLSIFDNNDQLKTFRIIKNN